jgi:hypothetical protein
MKEKFWLWSLSYLLIFPVVVISAKYTVDNNSQPLLAREMIALNSGQNQAPNSNPNPNPTPSPKSN